MTRGKIIMGALALLSVVGCTTYTARPIDWHTEAQEATPGTVLLTSLDEVAMAAVIGNEELRMARLKLGTARKVAELSGLWEDPELDVDALHFTKMSDHPFTRGASLAFTLPLSGVPGLEKESAKNYARADALALVGAEIDVSADAKQCALKLQDTRRKIKVICPCNPCKCSDCSCGSSCASNSCKCSPAQCGCKGFTHELHELRHEEIELNAELVKLLGYVAGTRIDINITAKVAPVRDLSPLDLTKHPKVREHVARLDGSESAFNAEVRKQYPDLKLGPAYEREEGIDRLGIIAGFSLPLWNRNRKGIAQAEGERDEARECAICAWRDLVREYHTACEMRKLADGDELKTALANINLSRFDHCADYGGK